MTRVYVSVIIRNNEGKFLVLRRSQGVRFAPDQWEFVNGSIDTDESAEEAAVREVAEETGMVITEDQLVAGPVHELHDSDGRWVVIPFRVSASGDVRISSEHQSYKWVTEDEIYAIPYVGQDYKVFVESETA